LENKILTLINQPYCVLSRKHEQQRSRLGRACPFGHKCIYFKFKFDIKGLFPNNQANVFGEAVPIGKTVTAQSFIFLFPYFPTLNTLEKCKRIFINIHVKSRRKYYRT
jgi:hypothetical protein